jgi:hypothetical protein
MKPDWRVNAFLGSILLAGTGLAADAVGTRAPSPLATPSVDPKEFGIADDTITIIPATSFHPQSFTLDCGYSPSLALYCSPNQDVHYFATLDLPAGVLIDKVGINTLTDTDYVIGLEILSRDDGGNLTGFLGYSAPAHPSFATDYAPLTPIFIPGHQNKAFFIDVETAPNPNYQYFAWVEVWWHRTVSQAPGTPTFNDVPGSDPAYQYIEALAASGVTGGCGSGNYCPDAPLTRRQMAVFLSKALGLHYPR